MAFALGVGQSLSICGFSTVWPVESLRAKGLEKRWQAGAFAGRYLIFFAAGYVIVKALDVSPLPVVFGLFASTAAVLLSSVLELFGSFSGRGRP